MGLGQRETANSTVGAGKQNGGVKSRTELEFDRSWV